MQKMLTSFQSCSPSSKFQWRFFGCKKTYFIRSLHLQENLLVTVLSLAIHGNSSVPALGITSMYFLSLLSAIRLSSEIFPPKPTLNCWVAFWDGVPGHITLNLESLLHLEKVNKHTGFSGHPQKLLGRSMKQISWFWIFFFPEKKAVSDCL